MANRRKGAWNEALRLAVTKRLYSYDDVQPYPRFHSDSPVLLANFNSYNNDYELDIAKEVIAHACSLWCAHRDMFPARFNLVLHLDFFVWWYDGQVHTRRAKQPQLDNTIDYFAPHDILRLIDDALDDVANVAACDRGIITPANVATLPRLSPIAAADARPDAARQVDMDDTIHQLRGLGYDLTNQLTDEFALQSSQPLPTDFSHFEDWYNHFFDTWPEPPTIPYNRTPRVGIKMSASLTNSNMRVLLEMIPDFQDWADDIVALLV